MRGARSVAHLVGAAGLVLTLLVACSEAPDHADRHQADRDHAEGDGSASAPTDPTAAETLSRATGVPTPSVSASAVPEGGEYAVDPPGPLTGELYPADLLVFSTEPLDEDTVRRVGRVDGVTSVEPFSLAQVSVENQAINVAAVDPGSYRRYAPQESAQLQEMWDRVAAGEVAMVPRVARRAQDARGYVRLGAGKQSPKAHIGALARQVPRIDAVVNSTWGEVLGMKPRNAAIVSTGRLIAPQSVREPIERLVGEDVSVQILGPDLDTSVQQTALLVGGPADAVGGTFTYRVLGGGRIAPDPAWVSEHIATEEVPILGTVTCNKLLFPQLRAALEEVVARGLADRIHPGEYAGCYYPRFIAGSTTLSNHSFGLALDLNVPGNQRGTAGEMDRTVVEIFKRWGFAWGGDWNWTDPMHFEMNALVKPQ
jgi:hypothetical protein